MFLIVLFAVTALSTSVFGEETESDIYAQSGAEDLLAALPDEARELLSGISPSAAGSTDNMPRFLSALSEQLREMLLAPLKTIMILLAIVILCRIIFEIAPEELHYLISFCGTLCAAITLFPEITGLIHQASVVLEAVSVFLLAAVPVYAGLLISAGNAAAGTTYGALTLAAANGISAISTNISIPLLRVFLVFSAVSGVTSYNLKKLTDGLYKFLKWMMILAVTVFSGVLSVQTLVTAQSDQITAKAAKLIASSAIPIVGGAFGDALSAIGGSVSLIKSSVGAFGLLASLAVFLPICMRAVIWLAVCQLSALAADLFELSGVVNFLEGCAAVIRLLLASVISVGVVSVVSAAVVLCVRGAYG